MTTTAVVVLIVAFVVIGVLVGLWLLGSLIWRIKTRPPR